MKKLDDTKAFKILKKYKIPVVKQFLAKNEKQAVKYAKRIGYPVALKISSKDVIHKTDIRGLMLGIKTDQDVVSGYKRIIKNVRSKKPKAKIDGVLVQEMIKGREIIIGSKSDPQFGPVLLFGLGGIFVELLKDIRIRIIPVESRDAREMIFEIKWYRILAGVRGQRGVNLKALENCLLNVSRMVWASTRTKRAIKELDINPLFVNEKGVLAADVRIFL